MLEETSPLHNEFTKISKYYSQKRSNKTKYVITTFFNKILYQNPNYSNIKLDMFCILHTQAQSAGINAIISLSV